MIITFSTVLNIVLFSSIAIVLLNYLINKTDTVLKIGIQFEILLLVLIMFRLFFPFELPTQNNINITKFWPDIYMFFVRPRFDFIGFEWSVLSFIIILSIIGSFIFVSKLISSYIVLKRSVSNLKSVNDPTVIQALAKANRKFKMQKCFKVVRSSKVMTPFIFGLHNPVILLPEMELSTDELYYILSHEIAHYYYKDLWLRFFCELLQAIYWWNPFVYLLRKQLTKIQELRVDSKVMSTLSEIEKLNYLECLIKIARLQSNVYKQHWVASFDSDFEGDIGKRIQAIFNYTKNGNLKNKKITKQLVIGFVFVLVFFLMPNFIIFEPYATADEHKENVFDINKNNSYLMQNDDGTYDVYVDQKYVGTVTQIFDNTLKIYKN